jgi:hypothetical protein
VSVGEGETQRRARQLESAIAFTFLAHGAAMLGMLVFLLPMLPGGGGAGTNLDRVMRIAASPLSYRLGWLGWQVTAFSDVVFAVALLRASPAGWAWRAAFAQLVFVMLAIVPDQSAQFLLVTHGVDLARDAVARRDGTDFLAFEDAMIPLTTGWAALLYTLAAIGWAWALRAAGRWSRPLAVLSPPMLLLFAAISIAPLLPVAVRPSSAQIGAGNALAFTLLEAWFVAAFFACKHARHGKSELSAERRDVAL